MRTSVRKQIEDVVKKVAELNLKIDVFQKTLLNTPEAREEMWREYVKLLGDEIADLAKLAAAHGWKGSSPERVKKGQALRRLLGLEKKEGAR